MDIVHLTAVDDLQIGLLEEQKADSVQFTEWHNVLPFAILVGSEKEFSEADVFMLKKGEYVSWFHAKLKIQLWVTTSKRRIYKLDVIPYYTGKSRH